MAWGNVTVNGQDNCDIYIDGVYDAPRGKGPGPFVVTYGMHTFETLDVTRRVTASGNATVNKNQPDVAIVLTPVNQPAKPAVPPKQV